MTNLYQKCKLPSYLYNRRNGREYNQKWDIIEQVALCICLFIFDETRNVLIVYWPLYNRFPYIQIQISELS